MSHHQLVSFFELKSRFPFELRSHESCLFKALDCSWFVTLNNSDWEQLFVLSLGPTASDLSKFSPMQVLIVTENFKVRLIVWFHDLVDGKFLISTFFFLFHNQSCVSSDKTSGSDICQFDIFICKFEAFQWLVSDLVSINIAWTSLNFKISSIASRMLSSLMDDVTEGCLCLNSLSEIDRAIWKILDRDKKLITFKSLEDEFDL